MDTLGITANAVNTNQHYAEDLALDTRYFHGGTEYMRYDFTNSTLEMKTELQVENGFKTDTIDTLNNTNLSFLRNGSEYMYFQTTPERLVANKPIGIYGGRDNCVMSEGVEGSFNVLRIRHLDETEPYLILTCSDGVDTNNFTMTKGQIAINTKLTCNWYDGISDIDVPFRRNTVEYFTLDGANQIVNVAPSIGVSTNALYTTNIRPRANDSDLVFYGRAPNGTTQTEFMRHDHLILVLDISSGISFSGGMNSLTVNGDSLLDGNITSTGEINMSTFTTTLIFGDICYVREENDVANKRLAICA